MLRSPAFAKPHTPTSFIPAIRTPADFAAAQRRLAEILSSMTIADFVLAGGDVSPQAEEIQIVREAIDASPFRLVDGEVVSRGFTPAIVRNAG